MVIQQPPAGGPPAPVAPAPPDAKTQFEFARSVVQQIITLATGVIAVTVTFFDKFDKDPSPFAEIVMTWSWIILAAAILFGVLAMMALTGSLSKATPNGVYGASVTLFSGVQILLFVVGLGLTVWASGLALGAPESNCNTKSETVTTVGDTKTTTTITDSC
ncbi:MAG: putative rane protein [Pseudonocardiales bacterium]|nr:putative rane protein [Pseudonocardiales bacterium]